MRQSRRSNPRAKKYTAMVKSAMAEIARSPTRAVKSNQKDPPISKAASKLVG